MTLRLLFPELLHAFCTSSDDFFGDCPHLGEEHSLLGSAECVFDPEVACCAVGGGHCVSYQAAGTSETTIREMSPESDLTVFLRERTPLALMKMLSCIGM